MSFTYLFSGCVPAHFTSPKTLSSRAAGFLHGLSLFYTAVYLVRHHVLEMAATDFIYRAVDVIIWCMCQLDQTVLQVDKSCSWLQWSGILSRFNIIDPFTLHRAILFIVNVKNIAKLNFNVVSCSFEISSQSGKNTRLLEGRLICWVTRPS